MNGSTPAFLAALIHVSVSCFSDAIRIASHGTTRRALSMSRARKSGEPNTASPWSPMPIALSRLACLLGVFFVVFVVVASAGVVVGGAGLEGFSALVCAGCLLSLPPHPTSRTSATTAVVAGLRMAAQASVGPMRWLFIAAWTAGVAATVADL